MITDSCFMPVSMILPIAAHHAMNRQITAQIRVTDAQRHKLWQTLIKSKVKFQSTVLTQLDIDNDLVKLIIQVNSGDTRNIEAQAARKYWSLLFGNRFRRNPDGFTPNEMLNYGYTIIRSAIAREVCATGLHPAIGIHHKHPQNAFCLVDDLIEPYRPIVDYTVYHCLEMGEHELNSAVKGLLVGILEQKVRLGTQWVSVESSIQNLAQSLSKAYINQYNRLKLIKPNLTKLEFKVK